MKDDKKFLSSWLLVVLGLLGWAPHTEAGEEPLSVLCPADPAAASKALANSVPKDRRGSSAWMLVSGGASVGNHLSGQIPGSTSTPEVAQWRSGDDERSGYLVSRSLKLFPGLGSHLFVALGRFPGDPAAEVFSFTKGRGNRVRRTHGQAHRFDWAAWLALDADFSPDRRWLRGLNAETLAAPPWIIRRLADEVVESLPYRLFQTNSNTIAQAIANRASGDEVRVFENRPFGSRGTGRWREVEFRSLASGSMALCWDRRPPGLVAPFVRFALTEKVSGPGDLARVSRAASKLR